MSKPIDLDQIPNPRTQKEWRVYKEYVEHLKAWGVPFVGRTKCEPIETDGVVNKLSKMEVGTKNNDGTNSSDTSAA
ncbi:hypothetical protein NECAME_09158 [Necator americanus]|uniref:Uncharacterized protein n=1 Tax=Necator americanus TaxID=51031 RepID=W2TEK5_NECAM|nr:hypothetical protein NECAME_09158 [Necator americanus]ETN80485.1 hypothetical protein NECAME_09158 [Necator americanus]